MSRFELPGWARWPGGGVRDWTIGVEEEVMLIEPGRWSLAQVLDDVHPQLSADLARHVTPETHAAALELSSGVHDTVASAMAEMEGLRTRLAEELGALQLRAAAAGTHPVATWEETRVSDGPRYRLLHRSMRELARREPTFALHVHVGVASPGRAIEVANRLRAHLPLLLALSANSPFWQGRDTGFASARTPVFGTFPRTGIPRRFESLTDWARALRPLMDSGAIPEPTFLWWDVRLQPRLGTVEVRIMDAQSSTAETAPLVALVQAIARLEGLEGYAPEALVDAQEVLNENRFLAARDGMGAEFIQAHGSTRLPAREALAELLDAVRPHAAALGSLSELAAIEPLVDDPPSQRQRRLALQPRGIPGVVEALSAAFTSVASPAGVPG